MSNQETRVDSSLPAGCCVRSTLDEGVVVSDLHQHVTGVDVQSEKDDDQKNAPGRYSHRIEHT